MFRLLAETWFCLSFSYHGRRGEEEAKGTVEDSQTAGEFEKETVFRVA